MADPLSVLLVEDSEDDALLVLRSLRRGGFEPTWQRVQTAEALRATLLAQAWDVIISDYSLPGFNAPAALAIVKQSQRDLPFIVVSGTIGETLAVALMRAGAHDYLMKDNLVRLSEAVRREMREAQMRTERQQAELELKRATERLQLAIEGSGIGLWDWYVQTGAAVFNNRWAEIIGYNLSELEPTSLKTWTEHAHPEDWVKSQQALERHFQGLAPIYECEMRMRHRSGEWIWTLERGKVVEWDEAGNPLRLSGTHLDITSRKRTEAQIFHNSLHDALTNLPNRNLLIQRLELAIQRARRSQQPHFAVLFLDLDHFKVINDSLGHLAGDMVLILVAKKVRSLIRTTDMAARLGGDEFVILLEDIDSLQDPVRIAERLFSDLQMPLQIDGREVFINTSIGIVMGSPAYKAPSDLLRNADIAMYRAKAKGRGQYAVFNDEMHSQALQRLQLEQELRRAIDHSELLLHFQPIIQLSTGKLHGLEALVRWQHPEQGLILPDRFIPIAEETGLIMPLDRWVLHAACRQLALWHQRYPQHQALKVNVNLSVKDLLRPDLLADIDQLLAQTGLQGQHLSLEITESMLIENVEASLMLLKALKLRGIPLTIDDFGTGYSSLSYLHQLPVDAFKIDRSFVVGMETNHRNTDIVETIIALSNRLGLNAIAEGVETQRQLETLQQLGCELGQGYWFAKPLEAGAVDQFLATFVEQPSP